MILCYDSHGDPLLRLYQWDVNQKITVTGIPVSPVPVFHFAARCGEEALVVSPTVSGSSLIVDVPNILLQQPEAITLYIYKPTGTNAFRTMGEVHIPVIPRAKPDDYEYTDNVEYLSMSVLRSRLDTLLQELSDGSSGDYSAELIDIRTAADATVYTTAGNHVRAIEDEMENVRNLALGAYPAIVMSGDTVTFSDTGPKYPVQSIEVLIEPIQSGTGTPSVENIRPISGTSSVTLTLNGTDYTKAIPSNPGTVYGGKYDFITGVLTVDMVFKQFDGTETWETYGSGNKKYFYHTLGDYGSVVVGSGICSHFDAKNVKVTTTKIGQYVANGTMGTPSARVIMRPTNVSSMTVSDFKAWLADQATANTPVQLAYQLKTPIIYQLTPASFELEDDNNVVTSNCAGVRVLYEVNPAIAFTDTQDSIADLRATMAGETAVINLSSYSSVTGFINDSGSWNTTSSSYKHCMIPVSKWRIVDVTASSDNAAIIAFLTTKTVTGGQSADFATGETGRIVIAKNKTDSIMVPSDAAYMYVYFGASTDSYPNKPSEIVVYAYPLSQNIEKKIIDVATENLVEKDELQDAVDEIDEKIDEVSQTISDVVSLATITGDADDTYTIHGITLTKRADNEFTLTGNASKNVVRAFNVLLGSEQTSSANSTVLTKNISTPGTYTLAFTTSGASVNENYLFAISDNTVGDRKYISSGESFTVTDTPVCLFVYALAQLKLGTKTLTVRWALYEGEEYIGYPYVENGQLMGKDLIARNLAIRAASKESEETAETASWGKSNVMANARQIMDIKWTPVASTMPQGHSSYYEMGVEYTGIPYSSVRDSYKAVGINVSIHTFMTAVHDPNSVLYTRRSTCDNSDEYYGSVCSVMTGHAYGYGMNLKSTFLYYSDLYETIPMQDIQVGDALITTGHIAIIYDVKKDKWGRINEVTVIEEWSPLPRYKHYSSYKSFVNNRQDYIARRYKNMAGVSYTQIPFVRCFDEDAQEFVYPDVQTDHGDQAVFGYCAGSANNFTDYANNAGVTINVIDPKDFTSIVVTREGASSPVYSTSTIASFTIPGADILPGLYTVTATGPQNTSVSTFFVADVNGTWDLSTGIVTFSSTNATPIQVDVYKDPDTPISGDYRYNISNNNYIITDADRAAGMANVLDLVDTSHKYAKVTFSTPYGHAIWRSDQHHPSWVAIT